MAPRGVLLASLACVARATTFTFGTTPSQSNVLLVSSTGVGNAAVLTELQATTGASVQSLSLTGCSLGTVANQGYGGLSANGYYALFVCGSTTSTTRFVARVMSTGLVDTRCVSGWQAERGSAAIGAAVVAGRVLRVREHTGARRMTRDSHASVGAFCA